MGKQPRRSCCAEKQGSRGGEKRSKKAGEREKTWLPDKVLEVGDWRRRTRQENFNISSEMEPRQTGDDTLHNIRQEYWCGGAWRSGREGEDALSSWELEF